MSASDQAISELEEKRARENAERQTRHQVACVFLKEFYESDVATSKKLKAQGVRTVYEEARILLERLEVGGSADGMTIMVGELGDIDVNGKSLGPIRLDQPDIKKNELIAAIISHFSL